MMRLPSLVFVFYLFFTSHLFAVGEKFHQESTVFLDRINGHASETSIQKAINICVNNVENAQIIQKDMPYYFVHENRFSNVAVGLTNSLMSTRSFVSEMVSFILGPSKWFDQFTAKTFNIVESENYPEDLRVLRHTQDYLFEITQKMEKDEKHAFKQVCLYSCVANILNKFSGVGSVPVPNLNFCSSAENQLGGSGVCIDKVTLMEALMEPFVSYSKDHTRTILSASRASTGVLLGRYSLPKGAQETPHDKWTIIPLKTPFGILGHHFMKVDLGTDGIWYVDPAEGMIRDKQTGTQSCSFYPYTQR